MVLFVDLVWLHRSIDRLRYGDRGDPVQALRTLGDRLRRDPGSLGDLLTAVRESLRLPFAAFRPDGRETATSGQAGGRVAVLPLLSSDNGDVELVVSVRPGQSRPDPEDLRVFGPAIADAHDGRLKPPAAGGRVSAVLPLAGRRAGLTRSSPASSG
jgi:hypothetical protein